MTTSQSPVPKSIPYVLGSDSITVYLKGVPFTINKQAHTFKAVINAINTNDMVALDKAINVREDIVNQLKNSFGEDLLKIEGNQIFFAGREIQGLISSRIFEMINLGLDTTPMVLFLTNLMQNPSKRAVDELFGFMEACTLPITPDGFFLAYKRVNNDYTDVHSGTISNTVGSVVKMERNLVDEDKSRTCSAGLHFCSYEYLKSFRGERTVVLKINPKDVVAIPIDYNNSKGRTCEYTVVDELDLDDGNMPLNKIKDGATDSYSGVESTATDSNVKKQAYVGQNLLLDFEVVAIRNLLLQGFAVSGVAKLYSVSNRVIMRILERKTYKHVK